MSARTPPDQAMRITGPADDEQSMLIAGPRSKARVRSARRGAMLPAMAFAVLAILAMAVLAAYRSTGAALVTALLVYAAATPLGHAAGLRRSAVRPDRPAESTATRLS